MATGDELAAEDLNALTGAQFARLASLRVSERQEYLGGAFAESLETWRAGPPEQVLGIAFLLGGRPVGMTLFKRPPLAPDWVPDRAASLHGIKIALPWQGRGLGHSVFQLAVAGLRRSWPDIRMLMLAVDAENAAALAVYRRAGMTDSGPVYHGNHGAEHRMTLTV